MWGLWGRTEGAGCGGPRVRGAWRNGVKGQNEKRGRAWWPGGEVPRVQREAEVGVVRALRLERGWAGSGDPESGR